MGRARRVGKNAYYRLLDTRVADMWVMLREFSGERLQDLQLAMRELVAHADELSPVGGKELLSQARSLPLAELKRRLHEIPLNKPVVAFCRGPFCLMAKEAVGLLVEKGYRAMRLEDGVAEWRARGLPLV